MGSEGPSDTHEGVRFINRSDSGNSENERRIALPSMGIAAPRTHALVSMRSEREKYPHQYGALSTNMHMSGADLQNVQISSRIAPPSAVDIIESVRNGANEAAGDCELSRRLEEAERLYEETGNMNKWASQTVEQTAMELNVRVDVGLSSQQVLVAREHFGRNELAQEKPPGLWKIFCEHLLDPVNGMLACACVASLALREYVEGIAVLVIIFAAVLMATFMEKNAGDALAELALLGASGCTILRNGEKIEIPSCELVPGDVIFLSVGQTVPADVRLVQVQELHCIEVILTGEPHDVRKHANVELTDSPTANNMCFSATSVTQGNAVAIVVATGMNTRVGIIAAHLQSESGRKLTPLQTALNRLGGIVGVFSLSVLVIIVIIAITTNYEDPSNPGQSRVVAILMLAVGFAVGAIPEALPMVFTISLALGCKGMVKKNAQIRKLPAVETLGSCSIICSDKTGTLTEGRMTAIELHAVHSAGANKRLFFPTRGFHPDGGIFDANELTTERKQIISAAVEAADEQRPWGDFSSVLPLELNLGDPRVESSSAKHIRAAIYGAFLSSYGTRLCVTETGRFDAKGNMSEGALVSAAAKAGLGIETSTHDLSTAFATRDLDKYERIPALEVPFSSKRKMMITFHKLIKPNEFEGMHIQNDLSYNYIAVIKGAPDFIFPHVGYSINESSLVVEKTTENTWNQVRIANENMAKGALRVLTLCFRFITEREVSFLQRVEADHILDYVLGRVTEDDLLMETANDHGGHFSAAIEKPLVIVGLVGSLDPPREGVREAVQRCHRAGIKVMMITGDQPATAAAIAKSIAILRDEDDESECVHTCDVLHDLSGEYFDDEKITEITAKTKVFSRAQPEDKITIVRSLIHNQNHCAAMTGDGVNDAPALKAANIGIAMGITGTDVAKGAAEMVLLDDNFVTIVSAVEEGRKIYTNIQKFISFLLGTCMGEIFYLTIAICVGLPSPLQALQILFVNLLCDGFPCIALSFEPADDHIMLVPPRNKNEHIVSFDWWVYSIAPHIFFQGACVLASLVSALYTSMGVMRIASINDLCWRAGGKADLPYFCQCHMYTANHGWVTNINYYDEATDSLKYVPFATMGKFDGWMTPADVGLTGITSWPVGIPKNQDGEVCNQEGTVAARTMSFLTAVFCALFRPYTVRTDGWMWSVFNRSMWLHIATFTAAVLTILVTVIPGLKYVFDTEMVELWQYLLAIAWGFLNMLLDEFIQKPFYRFVLSRRPDCRNQVMLEQSEDDEKEIKTSKSKLVNTLPPALSDNANDDYLVAIEEDPQEEA